MKILLVQPPFFRGNIDSLEKYMPTGLIALAGFVREQNKDIDIKIYDANVEKDASIENITKFILAENPKILGLTSMTLNVKTAIEIVRSIKNVEPGIVTVMGGVHPTVAPEDVLSDTAVDFIVMGEGETTFNELLKNINNPVKYQEIDGLGYKINGKITLNKTRELIKDLNTLPIPAYDLLKIERYRSPYGSRSPFVSMMRSRGCPFRCIFCGVQNIFGRIYRVQSPKKSIEEVDYLINKFHVKEIAFKDSEFIINQQNTSEFCDLLIQRGYDLVWSCNARVDRGSLELYKKMKQAGCLTVTFGAESGNQNILNILKKDVTVSQIEQAIKDAKSAGLKTSAGFIIGSPYETKETIMETINLAKKINPDYVAFTFATPFPKTELKEMAEKNNWLLNESSTNIAYMELSMNATKLSNEELKKYMKKAYRSFYFRPSYILKRLTMFNPKELKTSILGLFAILGSYFKKD